MNITLSQLSRTQTSIALETLVSLLAKCPSSLRGFERACLIQFATSVAENMVSFPEGPIIISLSSVTPDAITASRVQRRLVVARNAMQSMKHGEEGKYFSAPSNLTQLAISPGTSPKNGLRLTTPKGGIRHSLGCLSALVSDSE